MSVVRDRSLAGRHVVITGANTGVGRATAEALAARGATLVLGCRSAQRARDVVDTIEGTPGAGPVTVVELDLGSLASVRRGAEAIREVAPRIDVLINNAGLGGTRGQTEDGFELAFGVNYLGHYLLTRALLPELAEDSRIVHVSSGSHARSRRPDLDKVERRTASLTGVPEYCVSKLCCMLFHHELARRLEGRRVVSLAADPGDVASDAWRSVPWPLRPLLTCRMKAPAEGARTSVFCATDPSLRGESGGFYVDCRAHPPGALSTDRALALTLWERSAAWVGLPPD